MLTKDFIATHYACVGGVEWALSISRDMCDVWDALIKEKKLGWLIWVITRKNVFTHRQLVKLVCRLFRETKLLDGRTVWDLFQDDAYRAYLELVEQYANEAMPYLEYSALWHTNMPPAVPFPTGSSPECLANYYICQATNAFIINQVSVGIVVLNIFRASVAMANKPITSIQNTIDQNIEGAGMNSINEQIRIISECGCPFQKS